MKKTKTVNHYGSLFIACVMTLSGCATPTGPDIFAESRNSISSINASVGDFAPGGVSSIGADPGKEATKGAIVGAAPGAVGMAAIAPMCSNPYTAGVCAVFLPIFGMMTVAGGGAGATHGESSGSMKAQAQRALTQAISEDAAQRSLLLRVVEYGTSTTNLTFDTPNGRSDKPSSDAYLDVAIIKADGIDMQGGFWGIVSTHYAVSLEARARLKRRSDGVIMADQTYRYVSIPRTPHEWSSDKGRRLISEIDNGYRQLAEWIIDDYFLSIQEAKAPKESTGTKGSAVFGEAASSKPVESPHPVMPIPMEPAVNFCKPIVISGIPFPPIQLIDLMAAVGQAAIKKPCDKSTPYITIASLTPTAVNSLRPTLRWNFDIDALRNRIDSIQTETSKPLSFSTKPQRPANSLSNVRYEVRVFLAEEVPSFHAGKKKELRAILPIYEKSGLVDSVHVLEKDIAPCSQYFWTTRAIFELNGATHSTEWAGNYWSVFEGNFEPTKLRKALSNERLMLMRGKPLDYAFPFSTPCDGKPMEKSLKDIRNNNEVTEATQAQEMKKPASSLSTSPSNSETSPTIRPSSPEAASPTSLVGAFIGKEIKTSGLAGLVKGIEIKLSFTNRMEKDIAKIKGKVKLIDDTGKEIGLVSFHSESRIPSDGNIDITQTIYPIIFPGYSKLKGLEQEKIKAEFIFESIEFADGSKSTN